jgi:hypothetical protein
MSLSPCGGKAGAWNLAVVPASTGGVNDTDKSEKDASEFIYGL